MRTVTLIATVVVALSCDSNGSSGEESKATSPPPTGVDEGTAKSAKAPPAVEQKNEPFDGKLTVKVIESARGLVRPFDPWNEALAKLEAKLGKPVAVDDNEYKWGVVAGDKCHYIIVENNGGQVGTVMGPAAVDATLESMYETCAAAAGIAKRTD